MRKRFKQTFFFFVARSVANVQAAIEHIYPLVYEFRKPRSPKEVVPEENPEVLENPTFDDSEDDDDSDVGVIEEDPLHLEPPKKKQKLHSVSHLTKRFKGGRAPKRPPGKMNDPNEDLIYVSDCDDPDDF